jgi:hypothetical protein
MTARGDGQILDVQKNLSEELVEAGSIAFDMIKIDGDPSAVIDPQGKVYVFGKTSEGGVVLFQYNGNWKTTAGLVDPSRWSVTTNFQLPATAAGLLIGDPRAFVESTGRVAVFVTTSAGHLIRYYAGQPGIVDLSVNPNNPATVTGLPGYSSPGAVQQGQDVFIYAANQQGQLVEYRYNVDLPSTASSRIVNTTPALQNSNGPFAAQTSRDVMVFQDVEAVETGGIRHVYATDGNSRLVHIEVNGSRAGYAENVSQLAADTLKDAVTGNDQAFGHFPFQAPYVGRVYSGVEVLVDNSTGQHFIYGTNGANEILFVRVGDALTEWRVANLTNDVYSPNGNERGGPGQAPANRLPANVVFGSPGGYVEPNGDRHIFQINAEGEVVEYYIRHSELVRRFHTQNVNLRTGVSPTMLAFGE